MLHQGIHSVGRAPPNHLLHAAEVLLKAPKSLFPHLFFRPRWGVVWSFVLDTSSVHRLVLFLHRGLLWAVPPGLAGFRLCFGPSGGGGGGGGATIVSPFVRGNISLGLSCLSWVLHLSGKLLQLFYQTLVDEAECFQFVRIGLCCFYWPRRPTVRVAWLIPHPWSVAPACVPCRYHQ